MNQIMVVHEDGYPFIRIETFNSHDALRLMLSRTHNRILDKGYAVSRRQEEGGQRVLTYTYAKTQGSSLTMKDIYVVVVDG